VREISGDVAQDVGELKRDAEVDRVLTCPRILVAEDLEADEPDRRRDTNAVLVEIVEGFVAARTEVHLDAFDQRLERLARKVERAHERRQRARLPRRGSSLAECGGELPAPPRKFHGGSLPVRFPHLVHRIVHGAAKVPDRDDRPALVGRQHEERVIEVCVAPHQSLQWPPASAGPGSGGSGFSRTWFPWPPA
jgi:hypothetical protein